MRKISLVNQKGGCGKTTTAINLASCLARKGKKVLLIDLDPQGHSALGLGVKSEKIEKSIYEVLLGEIPVGRAIQSFRDNFDAVFSNVVLSAFEQIMAGAPEREYKLTQSLKEVENNYDYFIFDCPPSIGLLTFNGLMASKEAIIPVDSSSFAFHGLGKLMETIQIIEEKAGHELSFKILATNIDRRTNFGIGMVEKLKVHFPENCFKTLINTCTRLREAASDGKPIIEFERNCSGFRDYQDLTNEIVNEEAKMKAKISIFGQHLESERPFKPIEKEFEFAFEAPECSKVQIAGDFNHWVPEDLHLTDFQDKQLWKKVISLSPGSYKYKYLIDGRWITDPTNDKKVDDSFGGVNSIINV